MKTKQKSSIIHSGIGSHKLPVNSPLINNPQTLFFGVIAILVLVALVRFLA